MKKLIIILSCLNFLLSSDVSENTFLFCLESSTRPLQITRSSDGFALDNEPLNTYFENNNILNIEKWIPQATEQDYDGDIYLNRIYRLYLSDNHREDLNSLISEMSSFMFVKYAENEY